jgi:hypothetical protein
MIFKILQIAVPFIWLGLIGGISFMETPLKFKAPNITLPLGLGIGRLVFSAMNKVEIGLAVLLLVSFFASKTVNKSALFMFGAIAFLLFLQTFWLLPALDARAAAIIGGNEAPASSPHIFYVVFEVLKFILLFSLGTSILKNYLKFE